MKLNPDFIFHKMDGETVLIPTANAPFHGLIQGNESVEVILECLSEDVTQDEIVDEMCRRFRGDRALIEEDVADVIARLDSIGAIQR